MRFVWWLAHRILDQKVEGLRLGYSLQASTALVTAYIVFIYTRHSKMEIFEN